MRVSADLKKSRTFRSLFLLSFGLLAAFLLSAANLDAIPPLWWDEGWTMNVAKNWVEHGYYGQVNAGELQPPGLSAAFPVVVPVALSFRLLGIGIWQGRLPGVIFMLGAIFFLFILADRLYGRKVGWTSLVILLLMPLNEKLHPILLGRQVLGEMPALFFLLLGFLFLLAALRGRAAWLIPAALVWGIALRTKAQVPPFWAISMLAALSLAIFRRWSKGIWVILLAGAGAWLAAEGIDSLQAGLLAGKTLPQTALEGYYSMSIVVPDLRIRLWALVSALAFGLPVIVGLLYALYQIIKGIRRVESELPQETLRVSLLFLAGSWMAWYLLMSMYWPRYLFPPLFIGSIFASALLVDFTSGLDFRATVQQAVSVFHKREPTSFQALAAILLAAWYLTMFVLILSISLPWLSSSAVVQAAEFIQQETGKDAVLESYEPQLQFLVDRRWHYPPDQVHIALNKRSLLDASTEVDYDPLLADPDYLVIGPSAGEWRLYDAAVASGEFALIGQFPPYQIYARVR